MSDSRGVSRPQKKRPGVGLMISGAIIAVAFAAFLIFAPGTGTTNPSPLWIAVIWGALMFIYGAFRAIRGRHALDHPRGGTSVDGK